MFSQVSGPLGSEAQAHSHQRLDLALPGPRRPDEEIALTERVDDNDPPESTARRGLPSESPARDEYKRLNFDEIEAPRLTHYLFRYPAKFHPPVVHALIREYSQPGDTLLDPYCGSGSLLVASAVEQRHAVGADVDPVAVFIASVKTRRIQPARLKASWAILRPRIEATSRSSSEYERRKFEDITDREYKDAIIKANVWVPAIPNLFHWFRRYVVVDLARLLKEIWNANMPDAHRDFFRLMFASILRNTSNADPVPVSGLEVTAHMKDIEARGRLINPCEQFVKATGRGIEALTEYWELSDRDTRISVIQADATTLANKLHRRVDGVITSPPYHNAVDYYRRHQLEMFWLAHTATQDARLALLGLYIGRARVRRDDRLLAFASELGPLCKDWDRRMREVSLQRSNAFRHYVLSMKRSFTELGKLLKAGRLAIFVLGHSKWNGEYIPTSELFVELAGANFELRERLSYPIKNRYMSFMRHNGANIDTEYVLAFQRTSR